MSPASESPVKKFFKTLFKVVRTAQAVLGTVVFLVMLVVFYSFLSGPPAPQVPAKGALLIQPLGFIVEKKTERDPFEMMVRDERDIIPETLMRDIAAAIRYAKTDERISALVIDMDYVAGAGLAQLHYIGQLIDDFKISGKPVYAYGIGFSDGQYLVASHADEIYMHPLGSVLFTGYGIYPLYFREAIDKIKATVHVFRAGEYKSYGEPFVRNTMSDEAKEENSVLLDSLWAAFVEQVSTARGIPPEALMGAYDTLSEDLLTVGGDTALLAMGQGFIDGLKTENEWNEYMAENVGAADNYLGYSGIDMAGYLAATADERARNGAEIAVVVVRGELIVGESRDGTAGSFTVIRHLTQALYDDNVKAVILRVDSGGGSLLASEMIREEIEALKDAGKPVIASMGSVAASGGYWISAPADEIWAQPTTITGSIGVVGILPTFEGSLAEVGIHSDGVGTTPLSGDFQFGQPLSPLAQNILQQSVDNSYGQFVQMVASYRKMEPEAVDAVGQGRVWAGQAAFDYGLVDHLGNLDDAIAAAGTRAGLTTFHVRYIEDQPAFSEKFAAWLFTRVKAPGFDVRQRTSLAGMALHDIEKAYRVLTSLNDPNGVYALCEFCEVR